MHSAMLSANTEIGVEGEPEPDVSLHTQPFAISAVCAFVSKFEDPMPAGHRHLLATVTPGGEDLPNDQSYRSAARFLAHLIKERKEQFDRPYLGGDVERVA